MPEQGVVLEDEADAPLLDRERASVLAVEGERALAHRLEPGDEAQERGLARAGRSEQRQKLARRDGEVDGIESPMGAEAFRDAADLDARAAHRRDPPSVPAASVPLLAERGADAPFESGFEAERDQRQKGEEGRQSEGSPDVVLIVEDLHLKRDRVGEAADVAGDDRHRAEFAHRPRVAEKDAREQRPADVGQRHGAGTRSSRLRPATTPLPRRRSQAAA